MQTMSVTVPRDALLQSVEQLNYRELNHFLADVLSLRARRIAPVIEDQEADILVQLSSLGLDEAEQSYLHTLLEKAEAETLSSAEHADLIKLLDKSERFNADRIGKIIQLAEIQQKPFDEVMQNF